MKSESKKLKRLLAKYEKSRLFFWEFIKKYPAAKQMKIAKAHISTIFRYLTPIGREALAKMDYYRARDDMLDIYFFMQGISTYKREDHSDPECFYYTRHWEIEPQKEWRLMYAASVAVFEIIAFSAAPKYLTHKNGIVNCALHCETIHRHNLEFENIYRMIKATV